MFLNWPHAWEIKWQELTEWYVNSNCPNESSFQDKSYKTTSLIFVLLAYIYIFSTLKCIRPQLLTKAFSSKLKEF